jgi:hypothetical protein
MTYYGLSLLSWLHLVHDLRPYPASLRTARGDADGGAA